MADYSDYDDIVRHQKREREKREREREILFGQLFLHLKQNPTSLDMLRELLLEPYIMLHRKVPDGL